MGARFPLVVCAAAVVGATAAIWLAGQDEPRPPPAPDEPADRTPRTPRRTTKRILLEEGARLVPHDDGLEPESRFAFALEAARTKDWETERKRLIGLIRSDRAAAEAFLADLATWPDEEAALRAASALPSVRAEGFEEHLIATAKGDGPALGRRAALIGLRGRGLRASLIVTGVATAARDVEIRAQATEELGSHASDPAAINARVRALRAIGANLRHESAEVRSAALRALLATPRPHGEAVDDLVEEVATSDRDEDVRALAKRLRTLRDRDE